jgi:hypothetical protein
MTLPATVQQACERLAACYRIQAEPNPHERQRQMMALKYSPDGEAFDGVEDLNTVAMHFLRAAGFLGNES